MKEPANMRLYSGRRARACAQLGKAAAVIPAAHLRLRNGDSEYEFRQDSDFYYLTGFNEPDAVLVLAPQHECERSVLFLHPNDRAHEIWNGRRLGVEGACETLGIDAAFPIDEIDARLPEYLCSIDALYYGIGRDEAFDRRMQSVLEAARERSRRAGRAPNFIADPGIVLHEMRLRKDTAEIEIMRRGALITAAGHRAAMTSTRPGLREYEIEALIEYEYQRAGATPAYTSIVAGGANATTLHYTTVRDELRAGDLLLVDSGAEFECYASDVTRTWPVDGRFTAEQRALYEIVLDAQLAGIDCVRPGVSCRDFHNACVRTIVEGLVDVGLLSGTVDENIETGRYRDYYMHGSGHWLGLDVHDAGRYRDDNDLHRLFEPGMVTTVEPGIYVNDDLSCDERFKGIGIRIEDDILVTHGGNENLTADIPKSIADLEAIVGSNACV